MAIKHKVIPFKFDVTAWSVVLAALDADTLALAKELSGLTDAGWRHWLKGETTSSYIHPGMLNFLNVCNLLDLDPRQFFCLAECQHEKTYVRGWIGSGDIVNHAEICDKCGEIVFHKWHYNDGGSTPGRDLTERIIIDRRATK